MLFTLAPALFAAFGGGKPARADDAAQRHHHHRRARVNEHTGRAPRDGSTGADATKPHRAEKAESIGNPNDGHLKGGLHVDLSRPYYRVVPVYESGDVRWGMPQLINMIDRAARTVHKRFPGAVLDVGDLSQAQAVVVVSHVVVLIVAPPGSSIDSIDKAGDSVGIGHIHGFVEYLVAGFGSDLRGGLREGGSVAGADGHTSAFAGKFRGHGAAEPGTGGGDNRDAMGES